jgi:hypothetical protein
LTGARESSGSRRDHEGFAGRGARVGGVGCNRERRGCERALSDL